MYSTRLAHLLLVVLSIVTFTQAAWFDFTLLQRSDGLVIRQDTNSSSAAAADDDKPVASASATEAAPTTSEKEKTTKAEETTTEAPPPATTSDKPAPTTKDDPPAPTTKDGNNGGGAAPVPSPTKDTPTAQPTNGGGSQPSPTSGGGGGGNVNPAPTTSSDGDKTTAAPSTTAKPYTTVVTIFSTLENGDVSTAVSSSTVTPTLAQESSSKNDNEGMSKETQNTIIGVCVGVGGAIVLAVVGLLIWRLRKRRQDQEDGEDLVNYGAGTSQFNSGGPEKLEPGGGSVSGRSPFQSTLESYHAPAQSNTGTNF
jgi:hypothetical protein